MGGMVDSLGGFLGTSSGPQAPQGHFGSNALATLAEQSDNARRLPFVQNLQSYGQGDMSAQDVFDQARNTGATAPQLSGLQNDLATGPLTGTKFATEQVQGNPILGGLYGSGGQLNQAEGKLSDLQNQGFQLKPEDQTLYGQTAGGIARQFGQQGNQTANDLASRGLSSSGAAGAAFSGLAGNQNEQLANAQQQIMQQRFQNTNNQIGQYQNFVNSMGANANNAINQQYGRQQAGVNSQREGLNQVAGIQGGQNNAQNQQEMQSAQFNASNKPVNFMDYAAAGAGQRIFNATSGKNAQQGTSAASGGGV